MANKLMTEKIKREDWFQGIFGRGRTKVYRLIELKGRRAVTYRIDAFIEGKVGWWAFLG